MYNPKKNKDHKKISKDDLINMKTKAEETMLDMENHIHPFMTET